MTTVTAVQIRIDTRKKLVDREFVVLSKRNKDEVEWVSEDNVNYSVRFHKRTPFHAHEFHVPANDGALSGPPLAKAEACERCSYESPVRGHPEHYKYEIWVGEKLMLDSEIVIKP